MKRCQQSRLQARRLGGPGCVYAPRSGPLHSQRPDLMTATEPATTRLDELCVDTIRTLSMDAVQKANSGHPGTPMALAPLAYTLYTRVMRHNPLESGLDRPRSLHPLGRSRLDAPLLDAVPDRLSADASRTSRTSARSVHRRPDIPSARTRPGSRPRLVRSGRGSRCPLVWRSPSGCSPPASTRTATRSSTTTRL